jgi:hypothetical protein
MLKLIATHVDSSCVCVQPVLCCVHAINKDSKNKFSFKFFLSFHFVALMVSNAKTRMKNAKNSVAELEKLFDLCRGQRKQAESKKSAAVNAL